MKTINRIRQNNSKKSSPLKRGIRGLLVILLVISLFFYRDSFWEIWVGLRQVTMGEIWVSILLAGAGYVLEGMTIFCMMGAVIPAPSVWDGIYIAFVCEFYRLTTLGNGSGIAEIHYLCKCRMRNRRRISLVENGGRQEGQQEEQFEGMIAPGTAAVLTMIQYIMKRVAIIGLGLVGFLILYQKESTRVICREYAVFAGIACLIAVGVIVIFLLLALSNRVANGVCWLLDKLTLKIPSWEEKFRKWKEQVELLNHSGKSILQKKKRMVCAVFIQMGKLLLFYGIVAHLLAGEISLGAAGCILLMALSFMLSGVIPTPSGAGALEFVFLLFFTRFVDGGAAVTAILVFRFATWICPAAVGGILLLL